ncbi:3'-phosphoadenosine 5'-phosphosulfate sulfotransferase [Oleispirillum naphthae]|uniref:3'-phosphoadenosine 5'-phosphosulfate sulfotransferase n=1 Tax=Oleispirillum naphthae TaxID=2838853 RepID=UPI0030824A39
MLNPFAITGPAIISFSGGRTSAYMLHEIIQAHEGRLPDDVQVAFANTGKEREETLRFVYECGVRWGVNIHWLEWRDAKPCFEEVGFNSASRDGEPFEALIKKKQRLPNWRERWCTGFLKVKVLTAFAASLGWNPGEYAEVIGLRYDEGMRIFRGLENAEKDGRKVLYPLSRAKVVKQQVMAFWSAQDFGLQLEPWEGNCDLCFNKGRDIRKRIIADHPASAKWWHEQEVEQNGFFDRRDRVADLAREVRENPDLLDPPIDEEEFDTECGLSCGYTPEAAE